MTQIKADDTLCQEESKALSVEQFREPAGAKLFTSLEPIKQTNEDDWRFKFFANGEIASIDIAKRNTHKK